MVVRGSDYLTFGFEHTCYELVPGTFICDDDPNLGAIFSGLLDHFLDKLADLLEVFVGGGDDDFEGFVLKPSDEAGFEDRKWLKGSDDDGD